jgi:transcriptional regulator with XRE-family HTH domain
MSNLLGEKIKAINKQHSLTLRQVASKLKINTAQLCIIENRMRRLNKDILRFFVDKLNISKGYILSLRLADQTNIVVLNEELGLDAMKIVELKLQTI